MTEQARKTLELLKENPYITEEDAQKAGITSLGRAVFDLRQAGFNIKTSRIRGSENGKIKNYVRYSLANKR